MTGISRVAVCLLTLLVVATGCGESGSSDGQQGRSAIPNDGTASAGQAAQTEAAPAGRPAIPPEPPETVEGLKLEPFFDESGTQTSLSVAAGELFHLYIGATHPNFDIKTAQWRLEVPTGIEIIGESKPFAQALSIGQHNTMFLTTFPCQTGEGTKILLKYNCVVGPGFSGGEFKTVKAEATHGHSKEPPFLGFVTCGDAPEMVPAAGGSASVTRKP